MAAALVIGMAGCGPSQTQDPAQNAAATAPDGQTADVAGPAPEGPGAVANLRTAQGGGAGTATATAMNGSVVVAVRVEGLPPGSHGAHVHMTGKCDAPTFASAGGHWNPASAQHGLENPQGQHAGDMPNLVVNEAGQGTLEYTLKGATLDGLFDADGAAMVIHASPDDQKTDPSGNSGDRIACGVFAAG
jgi:Cu-Zn family superoxide dismutase